MLVPPPNYDYENSRNTFNVARGVRNKIQAYEKIKQHISKDLTILPMVWDSYGNIDAKAAEFLT